MTDLAAPRIPVSTGRALAPDLARGGMLLLIAIAHAPLFVTDVERGPAAVNETLGVFHLIFVHNHARPLFAFLFGYALVQLTSRQLARGNDWPGPRKLIRRRGWLLVGLGLAHFLLLVPIDILAAYGLAGILIAGLLRAKDRTLLIAAGISLLPATAVTAMSLWLPLTNGVSSYASGSIAVGDRDLLQYLLDRLPGLPFGLVFGTLMVLPPMIFGIWAARKGFLDRPVDHRATLARFAVIGTAISAAGALPAILIETGWLARGPELIMVASLLQPLTGYVGGVALAAILALIAVTVGRRPGPITVAVQALGQRSLTFYLAQSVIFLVVFAGFDLQDHLGLTGATVVAVITWLVSIALAELLRRTGRRGPAEHLLRQWTYPKINKG
ncbi:DUF418 domain-containing protein [Microlunatus parietis]|uniref:Putative membrane protein YeiB n=1 Tax=Microlunatus parietis TaxID=682979 RepID=A0A7Y9LBQ5_9ACTN|nr:DUF418 domain-containing protein [Microlunatus parietis]NYE71987.1 putative membrane protein YeiB [Microlunatus parietis]